MRHLVFSGQAGDHPVLVTDEAGLRCLRFGTDERQTCIDLHQPWELQLAYTQWMITALLLHPRPEKFLLIGLGGGALPHFLLHHHPEARIDAVEKEQLVIDLAHDLFRLPRRDGLRIVQQDAFSFLRADPATGHHVAFLDIFGPGFMAPPLYDPELYRLLLERLSPDGILAVNLWSGDQAVYDQALQAAHEGCGGRLLRMQVKKRSNVILLGFAGEIPHQTIKKAQNRSADFQQRYGLDFSPFLKRLRRTNRPSLLERLFG
jgi:spermidine synthase